MSTPNPYDSGFRPLPLLFNIAYIQQLDRILTYIRVSVPFVCCIHFLCSLRVLIMMSGHCLSRLYYVSTIWPMRVPPCSVLVWLLSLQFKELAYI